MHRDLADFDLNQLLHLDVLLEEQSVARAARRAGCSPSAMSRTLGRLRNRLGDPLLAPDGRSLTRTPHAERLRGPLKQLLTELREILTPVTFDPRTSRGAFVVAASDYTDALLMPGLLRRISSLAPGLEVWCIGVEPAFRGGLQTGEVDFVIGRAQQAHGQLFTRRLFSDTFAVLACANHPQLADEPLDLPRYLELPHLLVTPGGRPGSVVSDALDATGHVRHVAAHLRNFLTAVELVPGSNRLLTLPRRLADRLARDRAVRVYDAPIELPSIKVDALWHARSHEDPAHQWLREQLFDLADA